jgi:hypothetical protein
MQNDKRKEMLYQKTEFNNSLICQLPTIFKCSKCKKNNTIQITNNIDINSKTLGQNCLFCGNPNYIKREKSIK